MHFNSEQVSTFKDVGGEISDYDLSTPYILKAGCEGSKVSDFEATTWKEVAKRTLTDTVLDSLEPITLLCTFAGQQSHVPVDVPQFGRKASALVNHNHYSNIRLPDWTGSSLLLASKAGQPVSIPFCLSVDSQAVCADLPTGKAVESVIINNWGNIEDSKDDDALIDALQEERHISVTYRDTVLGWLESLPDHAWSTVFNKQNDVLAIQLAYKPAKTAVLLSSKAEEDVTVPLREDSKVRVSTDRALRIKLGSGGV